MFEKDGADLDDSIRVKRVDNETVNLSLSQATIAELIRAAGLYLPAAANETARTLELKLEQRFLDYQLTVYDHQREVMADHGGDDADAYEFTLSNPCDVEACLWADTPMAEQTNLALARRLSLRDGIDMWRAFETMSKDGLIVALGGAPLGAGRGRGKGKGRGAGARGSGS